MQFEVGSIVEGKVTGVKNFGAFVELPGGVTGMVHISEVSGEYITQLSDVLKEGQAVKVKVLSISPEGRVALSIKKADPALAAAPSGPRKPRSAPPPKVWQPKPVVPQSEMNFEDMLSHFKQQSEEKIADVRRNTDGHRGSGGYSRRGRG